MWGGGGGGGGAILGHVRSNLQVTIYCDVFRGAGREFSLCQYIMLR